MPYYTCSNSRTPPILSMAETPIAIENLEAIVSASDVDAVFVGPFDLSVSLGIPGETNHPREIQAIDRVLEVCHKRKIVSGIHLFDLKALKMWVEKGMQFVTYSSDVALLADAAANGVAKLKSSKDKNLVSTQKNQKSPRLVSGFEASTPFFLRRE
jgi:2-keto-3-deoxy-L-rhamnonate aldolase RhmA